MVAPEVATWTIRNDVIDAVEGYDVEMASMAYGDRC